jgi:hypothetical protein
MIKFRLARHTSRLSEIVNFYQAILGFEVLGSFNNHASYDGVFIGIPGADWHLEFTSSGDLPIHHSDEDDLLVFYAANIDERNNIKKRCVEHGIALNTAKNPYWNKGDLVISDPDDYRIVVSVVK